MPIEGVRDLTFKAIVEKTYFALREFKDWLPIELNDLGLNSRPDRLSPRRNNQAIGVLSAVQLRFQFGCYLPFVEPSRSLRKKEWLQLIQHIALHYKLPQNQQCVKERRLA